MLYEWRRRRISWSCGIESIYLDCECEIVCLMFVHVGSWSCLHSLGYNGYSRRSSRIRRFYSRPLFWQLQSVCVSNDQRWRSPTARQHRPQTHELTRPSFIYHIPHNSIPRRRRRRWWTTLFDWKSQHHHTNSFFHFYNMFQTSRLFHSRTVFSRTFKTSLKEKPPSRRLNESQFASCRYQSSLLRRIHKLDTIRTAMAVEASSLRYIHYLSVTVEAPITQGWDLADNAEDDGT